jgi:outer membrane immunogenic protein
MKRLAIALLAATGLSVGSGQIATAADMPVKAPAPVAAPVHNWTGFYVGANIGGGWGNRNVDFSPNDPLTLDFFAMPAISFRASGVLGGLQLGYNWQFNRNWLLGLEADFDGSGMDGSGSNSVITNFGPGGLEPFTQTVNEKIKWFGTVRMRLGYLPTDNLLAYVTGGYAYGRVEHTGTYTDNGTGIGITLGAPSGSFSFVCTATSTCFSGSSSDVATGWTVGGGLEYAIWQHWTLKAEYLYVSLEGKSVTETAVSFSSGSTPASFNANYNRASFNVGRVGVNYRF